MGDQGGELGTVRVMALRKMSSIFMLLLSVAINAALSPAAGASSPESATGSLQPGESRSFPLSAGPNDSISFQLSWNEAYVPRSRSHVINVQGGSSSTMDVSLDTSGDIAASVLWDAVSKAYSQSGNASPGFPADHLITVTAGGWISFTLAWPGADPNPNLDLILMNHQGVVVASSNQFGGNSESIEYRVPEQSGNFSHTYTLRILAVGWGSDYNLDGFYPVTPNVDLVLESSTAELLATSVETSRRRRGLSYPGAAPGDYRFRVSSSDETVMTILTETHPVASRAILTLELRNGVGTVLRTATSTSGTIVFVHEVETAGDYWVNLRNESATTPAHFFELLWELSQGSSGSIDVITGDIAAHATSVTEFETTSLGDIVAEVDWGAATAYKTSQASLGSLSSWQTVISAGASGTINATLSWPPSLVNPDLDLYLLDWETGTEVASSEALLGNTESVSFEVIGPSYPSTRLFLLRVMAKTIGSSFTLSSSWPVVPDLDLELWNEVGQKIASSYSAFSKPERISAQGQPPGNYVVKTISADYASSYTLTVDYPH